MNSIISIEGISKKYSICHGTNAQYKTVREDLMGLPSKLLGRGLKNKLREFWALRDVSLEVRPGERIGIIGRNGAGKSTLLKLLARITEPSKGRIALRGRVASLLEVGTGFHPELTGRENIYLNGAILGMHRVEVKRKFDEIVAFAGVEKFLDTPVKRYSSGMYIRLAFAVAAHLEPEILIIDEVLAVGDIEFQRKCLGKMEEVSKNHGRTVLFVSHQLAAVRQLCSHAVWLADGRLVSEGDVDEVVNAYLRSFAIKRSYFDLINSQPFDPDFKYESVAFTQNGLPIGDVIDGSAALEIAVNYTIKREVVGLRLYFDIVDEFGTILVRSFYDNDESNPLCLQPGVYTSRAVIRAPFFGPKEYALTIRASIYNVRCCSLAEGITCRFLVQCSKGWGGPYPGDTFRAALCPNIDWETKLF